MLAEVRQRLKNGALTAVAAILVACSPPASVQLAPSNAVQSNPPPNAWPPFVAVYVEETFEEVAQQEAVTPHAPTLGRIERWQLRYESSLAWEMEVLDGQTVGGNQAVGGRIELHELPGTRRVLANGTLTTILPDGDPYEDAVMGEAAPNAWMQPRYGSPEWTVAAIEAGWLVERTYTEECGTANECVRAIAATLNSHGVPIAYQETLNGQIVLNAEVVSFALE